jgi:glycogen synthase
MTSVLMTADTVGGVWTYALELADALAPHGVEVTLATMGQPLSDDQRRGAARSAVTSIHESRWRLEWMEGPWDDVDRAAAWLLDLERDVHPDVVHLNGYAHAALPWRAPTVVVAHSCVVSWWQAVHGVAPPAAWDEYRRRVAAGLQAADAVVAPTAAMLEAVREAYGIDGGAVVANCRRQDLVRPGRKEPLVLAAGRGWDQAKNLAALERVAPRLGVPVAIAGDAAEPARPATGADGEGSRSAARWLGSLPFEELSEWMARAPVFAHPARYEPFGLAPLEAALAGCALVLGDRPSLREVWEDAALFVDPDDDDALLAALRRLLDDDGACRRLAHRAGRRARRYAPERTAAGYLEVYARLPLRARGAR